MFFYYRRGVQCKYLEKTYDNNKAQLVFFFSNFRVEIHSK